MNTCPCEFESLRLFAQILDNNSLLIAQVFRCITTMRYGNVPCKEQLWRYPMNTTETPEETPQRPFTLTIAVIVFLVICALLALLIGFLAFRATHQNAVGVIWVPDDYATIQAAIDAANPGDMIQVLSLI